MHKPTREQISLTNKNRNFLRLCASAILLLFIFTGVFVAQHTKVEPPGKPTAPKPESTPDKIQTPPKTPGTSKPQPAPTVFPKRPPVAPRKRRAQNEEPTPAEKFIKTDAKINISLCVAEGNIRINGWERNEIRVFVNGGSKVGFKVLQKSRTTQNPVWVEVLGYDPTTDKTPGLDECLAGEQIELDVPRAAIVGLKSRESEIFIDSVAKARIENVSGDIFLRNIAGGIEATTFEGDVTVENSGGAMTLLTTTGNILAVDVEASEIGDAFKARTRSGAVTLQSVGQRDLEISSASGTIRFAGEFSGGGRYNFNTTNGSILLGVPSETSCKVSATYALGAFQSDLPMTNVVKVPSPQVQKLTGTMGAGECSLNLSTFSGAVRIRKQ
jgi:hypothetical protein